MDARTQIGDVIADNMVSDEVGNYIGDVWTITADAILAALPAILRTDPSILRGMVKPLVWEKLSERHYRYMVNGKLSWRCEAYVSGEWYLTYSVPGYCDTLIDGKWATIEAAQSAANAHNVAATLAQLGVE